MERFNRAERIAQTQRLKTKRARYWGRDRSQPMTSRQVGMVVATPKLISSCQCCGNPRRTGQRMLAELCVMQPKLFEQEDTVM